MKKMLAIVLSVLFMLAVGSSFFAEQIAKESKDLTVVYTNNCEGMTVPVVEGKAAGTLPDGTEFSVENLPNNAVTLRIYPVQKDEKDVQDWVEDHLAKEYDAAVTYYVSCADANGKELSNDGVKVTITAPETKDTLSAYSLDSNGKVQSLTATYKGGKISFTATGAQLYPLCVAAKNAGTSDWIPLYFAVFSVVSLAAVGLIFAKRKGEN